MPPIPAQRTLPCDGRSPENELLRKTGSSMKAKVHMFPEPNGGIGNNHRDNMLESASPTTTPEAPRAGCGFARRSFVKNLALGAAALLPVRAALADSNGARLGRINESDAAILRFLA